MDFAAAATPYVGHDYAARGHVGPDGSIRGGGLGSAGYVAVVLERMRHGADWLRHHGARLHELEGDTVARHFGLQGRRAVAAADLLDGSRTQALVRQGVLHVDQLYLFQAGSGPEGHLGFLRVRAEGRLVQSHYTALAPWRGLAAGDFRAFLRACGSREVVLHRVPPHAAPPVAGVPRPGELNEYVLEVMRRYPTDGTHAYHWPKQANGWRGCTRDLDYAGERLCAGDAQGRCYCCGLTFEVFLEAWQLWCQRTGRPWRIGDLDLRGVRRLQSQWFGSAEDTTCLRTALVDNALGARVTDWEQARAGDFVQLWRRNGSGHSVVFLAWVREQGRIVGLRYWSTQPATDGIGERVEYFDRGAGGIDRERFYLCRVGATAQ
jgi:hypothetical protein